MKKLYALMIIMSLVLGTTAVVFASGLPIEDDADVGIQFLGIEDSVILPPWSTYWWNRVGGDYLDFGHHRMADLEGTVFRSLDAEHIFSGGAPTPAGNTAGVLLDTRRAGRHLQVAINGFTLETGESTGAATLEGFTLTLEEYAVYGRLLNNAGGGNATVFSPTINAAPNGGFGPANNIIVTNGLTSMAAGFEGVLDIVSIYNIHDMGDASADLLWTLIAAPVGP